MSIKRIVIVSSIFLLSFSVEAQKPVSFYPFKGFHVGLTGQAEFITKCSFVALTGSDPAPKTLWTRGSEVGIEFSYHFAKYFGISLGINYGTTSCYIRMIDLSNYPHPIYTLEKKYRNFLSAMGIAYVDFLFPIKLEFHYPLRKGLFFTTEMGIKLKGISERLSYGKDESDNYWTGLNFTLPDDPNSYHYYMEWGSVDMSKISCNLLLGLGLYYQLPYGDLLRFTAGVNLSFNKIIEGYYRYFLTDSYGTFAVKNDFIYTQFAYIHTLNWQKAKKYVKKQEYTFASKKERREKMYELLRTW